MLLSLRAWLHKKLGRERERKKGLGECHTLPSSRPSSPTTASEASEPERAHLSVENAVDSTAQHESSNPARTLTTAVEPDCPGGHGLVHFIIPRSSQFICDICLRSFPAGTGMHGCRACEYDVCDFCRSGAVHVSASDILFAVRHARLARAAAALAAAAADLGVAEAKLAWWREHGGGDLEPVLASGAVALLDAQWIISHAEAGGVLNHRQALPKEAFLSLADLVEMHCEAIELNNKLPIVALSYPWLTKDHPDPRGANLARVARALKALLTCSYDGILRLGVFWDFGSLHQHPDPANGVLRTEEQNALFKQGLGCLGTLYSHPHTWVLRLTSFPDGHKAEDQAEGTNVADYFDRGWCATENAWASLTKAGSLSLDLGKMRDGKEYDYYSLRDDCTQDGGRRPPLLPAAFAAELETKSFTNGKDDKPLVKRLYEAAFEEQFGKATKLNYSNLGWGDAEAAQLAEVLASGAAPRLETLWLFRQQDWRRGLQGAGRRPRQGGGSAAAREARSPLQRDWRRGLQGAGRRPQGGGRPELEGARRPPHHSPLPPLNAHRASPRVQALEVNNMTQPELVAVCEERGIRLR